MSFLNFSGYRKFLSYSQCIRSLFKIHNETGNCWTHLIGLIGFFLLTIYTVFIRMNSEDYINRLVFFVFLVSAQICFLGSTVYHLFHCHSEQTMILASRLDYSGIAALITGSFFPPIYFSFYCFPFWQISYLSLISSLGFSGVILSQFPFYHKHSFTALRISHMVGTALVGMNFFFSIL